MDADREPFGDDLFVGIEDLDQFIRATIRSCSAGIDARQSRAAARTRTTYYRGGPVPWDNLHTAEDAR